MSDALRQQYTHASALGYARAQVASNRQCDADMPVAKPPSEPARVWCLGIRASLFRWGCSR